MSRFLKILIFFAIAAVIFDAADRRFYKGQLLSGFSLGVKDMAPRRRRPEKNKPAGKEPAAANICIGFKPQGTSRGLSAEDAVIKKQLEAEIAPAAETIFHLKDGSKVTGITQDTAPAHITVKQVFGHSGSIVRKLSRKDILWVEAAAGESADITIAEIKVRKEFKDFKFYRKGVYSFFTDQDYFKIAKAAGLLGGLYAEFSAVFNPLIDQKLSRHTCVIIFGKPDEYRSYAARTAAYLAGSAGFYNPEANLFALYNFFEEAYYKQADDHVRQEKERIRQMKEDNKRNADIDYRVYQRNLRQIERYEAALSAYMTNVTFSVKGNNIEILRHEAAHQLSFELGVLANPDFDTWLIEGLAVFCQPSPVGAFSRENLKLLSAAIADKTFIPLRDLFFYSDNGKFYLLGAAENIAYKESWALFYYLMQPEYRPKFFKYIIALNNRTQRLDGAGERIKFFEDNMGVGLGDLEKGLLALIKKSIRQ